MRRRGKRLALFLAVAVSATACGTQVGAARRQQAARAILTVPNGQTVTGGGSTEAGGVSHGGSTTPSQPGTVTAGGAAAPGSTGSGTRPGASASTGPLPPGGNGGATDIGVTATSITVGNVSDLSGPQPGLFQTAVDATNAYFSYINDQGGVYGRQLKLAIADSQTTCQGATSAQQQLISKVLAFSGSTSLFDQCGASVLAKNPKVADSHTAFTAEANKLSTNFSIQPLGALTNGPYAWAAGEWGNDVKSVGFLYPDLPSVTAVASVIEKTAKSAGWNFIYKRAVSVATTDYTPDIIQMRSKGVKVFVSLLNADAFVQYKANADQQNFAPTTVAPIVYDGSFFTKMGGAKAAEDIYGWQSATLFLNADEAKAIPAVAAFQKYFAHASHGGTADRFAANAWAQAALLVDAIKKAGPAVTRAKVLAVLSKTTSYNADGFIAAANPAGKRPPTCYVIWRVHSGAFQRLSPTAGFRCDGQVP